MATHPRLALRWLRLALVLALLLPSPARSGDDRPVTLVGMHGHMEGVVLPGPELEVRPLEDSQAPFVLRIANVHPHGTAFRYDFVYYALEPGSYDLTRYLQTKDGSAVGKLPPLEVEIRGLLAPGLIHPHALESKQTGWFLRYRTVLIGAAVLWTVGLMLGVVWSRRRKAAAQQAGTGTATVADRLRPLVIRAMTGGLTADQRADLERTLLAFWRQRLGLEKAKAPEALAKMRQHPEAGVLLNQLELWLHRPGTAEQVDIAKLLWPYQLRPVNEPGAPTTPQGAKA